MKALIVLVTAILITAITTQVLAQETEEKGANAVVEATTVGDPEASDLVEYKGAPTTPAADETVANIGSRYTDSYGTDLDLNTESAYKRNSANGAGSSKGHEGEK